MDRGPVRVPRPAANRAETRRQDEPVAQVVAEQPKQATPHHVVSTSRHAKESKSARPKGLIIALILAITLVVSLIIWLGWSKLQSSAPAIDSSKYQAVFFTNGQVYFGKLTALNNGYMKLTDVFYLQSQATESKDETDSKNPQEGSADNSNFQLIKLGQEVHGPEDAIIISRDQVLFYENLKSDGKVVQTIGQYKDQ